MIGDVHGCFFTLKDLLAKIDKNARVIFLGDLCDRGLYSKEVIELVIEKNYECVLGNHEDFMIRHIDDYLKGKPNRWYDSNRIGGKETIKSYQGDKNKLLAHIKYLKKAPRYLIIDKFFITHAFGLPYYKRRDSEDIDIKDGIVKARPSDENSEWGENWEKDWKNYEIINIFGHTIYPEVERGKNYYGIDTGCQQGGKLTAIRLEDLNIIDVPLNPKDKTEYPTCEAFSKNFSS